jgi:hypothetical protein
MPQQDENLILIKRSNISGVEPDINSLYLGELGLNTADGKLFTKTEINSITSIKTFLNSEDQYFVFDKSLSGVNTQYGNNVVSEIFGTVLGGINNNVSGGGSTIVNGEGNNNAGDFSIIGAGFDNKISQDCGYSFIAAGSANLINHQNVFTFGSNLSSHASNFTYVNNISAQGKLYGTLLDWMTLVRGYKTTPTLLATIGTGEVYTYIFETTGADITYYRYIATDGSEDSFYGNFTNPTLSNLITRKAIIL